MYAARQDFPRQVAWWLGGWVRKAENKAKAQHSWGLGLAELANNNFNNKNNSHNNNNNNNNKNNNYNILAITNRILTKL